jgi:magnesium transporter
VAVINGLLWSVVVAVIVLFWFGSPLLALVIALAMVLNQICGALAGVGLPLLLKKLDIDPALAGSVVLTTITDVVGFFAFLGLGATLLL